MPIQLIDIPRAVADYLNNEVLTTVSEFDGKLSRGEDAEGEVVVQNGLSAAAGVQRLINLRLHLQIEPRPGIVLSTGDAVRHLDSRSALGPFQTVGQRVSVRCREHGDVNVTCHVHADVDLSSLFPNSRNHDSACELKVGF